MPSFVVQLPYFQYTLLSIPSETHVRVASQMEYVSLGGSAETTEEQFEVKGITVNLKEINGNLKVVTHVFRMELKAAYIENKAIGLQKKA